jgi:hypothetical protein
VIQLVDGIGAVIGGRIAAEARTRRLRLHTSSMMSDCVGRKLELRVAIDVHQSKVRFFDHAVEAVANGGSFLRMVALPGSVLLRYSAGVTGDDA